MLKRTVAGRLAKCERGNAMLVSAAALPLLIGSAALAYDTVQLAVWIQQLQEVTDASAVAGAEALAAGRPVAAAVDRRIGEDQRVRIVPPVLISSAGDQRGVRVVVTSQRRLIFLGAMMAQPPTRLAQAVVVSDGKAVRIAR